MRISPEQLANISATAPQISRPPRRRDIARLINKLRNELKRDIEQHMQPWMLLLDESVRFFIHFEQYQYSRDQTSESSPFVQQISRLRSDAVAIRDIVALGQEGPAYALARFFIDDVELAMALAADPEFAIQYFNAEDGAAFWKNNIGYGKIYTRVERFLELGGGTIEQVREHIDLHRSMKNALSGHVHTDSFSSFRSGAVPSLSHPGMLHVGQIGALSAHLPRLCLLVANEAHVFSASCINLFIRPDAPPALKGYKPTGLLGDTVASAHVLQELIVTFGAELDDLCESFFPSESTT